MERIIAICLIVYAISVIVYFVFEKRTTNKTVLPTQEPEPVSYDDIIGKSHYTMSQTQPQAATVQEVDIPTNKESIFVPETEKKFPVNVPNEELEEVFSESDNPEITAIYVPLEYEEEDMELEEMDILNFKHGRNDFARGVSIEEMNEAIKVSTTENATDEERKQAGKIFNQIEGNNIYEQLIASDLKRKQKINELMNFYLDGNKRASGNTMIAQQLNLPEAINEFDIHSVL